MVVVLWRWNSMFMSVLVAMICMNKCLGFSFGTSGFLRSHQRGNVLLAAFDERAGGGGVAAVKGYLVGKYSNKLQAENDHAAGKMTGAQGGHEFVTASIAEHSLLDDVVIATYYYGEDVSAVFRYRLYELCALDTSEDSCRMKLYRPTLDHDEELKKTQYSTRTAPTMENFEYLQGCDVIWKKKLASGTDAGVFFEGTLEAGECVICSQQDPSRIVKVRDDLKLSAKELWINDRVYTTDGTMIIGNVEGVPYKLLRQQEEQD